MRSTVVNVSVALAVIRGGASAAAHDGVLIQPGGVAPQVLTVPLEVRVPFTNATGRLVHLQFIGDLQEHHVFQVRGSIWAVFHRLGRHEYVVHFYDSRMPTLQGVVDVEGTAAPAEPGICRGITVEDTCIEP